MQRNYVFDIQSFLIQLLMQELYQFALAQGATPPFILCVSLPRTPLPLRDLRHKDIVELQIEGVLILVEEDLEGCLEEFVNLCDAQVGCLLCVVRLV